MNYGTAHHDTYSSFHFDTAAGGGLVQPCEAAYLSSINPSLLDEMKPPEVKVLVV